MAAVQIMGILNVTPDSFSDGGQFNSVQAANHHAAHLIDAGADIIDIGGESTRPFAQPVNVEEELQRTIPVIKAIREWSATPISIDTRNSLVARQALDAGATIINDVSALQHDPEMVELARETDAPLILMHMQNNPETMQVDPQYEDVMADIMNFFSEYLLQLEKKGIKRERITIDPGIGFGKTLDHNLSILKHLDQLNKLGRPILLGHSRKRFLGDLTGEKEQQRDFATAVVSALAVTKGAAIIRVHDVPATKMAITIASAIETAQ